MSNSTASPDIDLAQLRSWAIDVLSSAGVPDPEVDVDILLSTQLGMGRGELVAKLLTQSTISSEDAASFRVLISRRETREPLQHILGVAWFRSLTLAVGPGVFVPRPETENLVGLAIDILNSQPNSAPIVVDLGTGSGAIALSIAKEIPNSIVYAVEKSVEAIKWTKQNFMNSDLPNASLIFGDFGITELLKAHPEIIGQVSVIVSNPPYIPSSATPREPEVYKFDPEIALYGGEDGLQFIKQIAYSSVILGCDGASLLIEHGEHQSKDVQKIFYELGLKGISTIPDLNGRERYTVANVVKLHP